MRRGDVASCGSAPLGGVEAQLAIRGGMMASMDQGWEDRAADWIAWTRAPGLDPCWAFSEAFFALVPAPAGPALEVGCGEGRVTRDLTERGHATIALDASPTLVAAAIEADPGGSYLVADALALPFGEASFALVVAYNVLMDVPDAGAVVREAARVLRPGGRLCLCLTHPLSEAGAFAGEDDDAPFVVEGSYLTTARYDETVTVGGRTMRFDGTRRSVSGYVGLLEDAGLLVEAVREPVAGEGARVAARWRRIPMFLMVRALKPG